MRFQEIKRIMKENDKYARMLEEFDSTGHLPIERIRRSFTIKRMSYQKLKELSKRKGKPMSRILDDLLESS